MPYGTVYGLTDFIDRLIPQRKPANGPFIKEVISGLKRIALIQNQNPWLTISPSVTAGVWLYYQNRKHWLLNPAQDFIRLETAYGQSAVHPDIAIALEPGLQSGHIVDTGKAEFKRWRVSLEALPFVWAFIEGLDSPEDTGSAVEEGSHPRYFPAEARVMALQMFEQEGRKCPGVRNRSQPHAVDNDARIEFDHILPHSKGGSSNYRNIQVLCAECNRLKGATAA